MAIWRPNSKCRPEQPSSWFHGGLTLEQAIQTPGYGAPLVVIGAPLAVDADSFKTASGNLESTLRLICDRVHAYGDITKVSS